MSKILVIGAIAGWIPLTCLCSCNPSPAETGVAGSADSGQFDETNPLGANAACYVCHMTFVGEELSKTHLQAKITCVDCHGLSAGHANDENIGATPPDISFDREEVDAMCLKCHERHDILTKEVAVRTDPPTCTDCHGGHRIIQTVVGSERSVTWRRYRDEVMTSRL
jgi:hypothetical protein